MLFAMAAAAQAAQGGTSSTDDTSLAYGGGKTGDIYFGGKKEAGVLDVNQLVIAGVVLVIAIVALRGKK
jgi:hypothetical protein